MQHNGVELVSIIAAPPGTSQPCIKKDAKIGDDDYINFFEVPVIGFENFNLRLPTDRPHTRTWYGHTFRYTIWTKEGEHENKHRLGSGLCSCDYKDCRSLGIINRNNEHEFKVMMEEAKLRLEYLCRVEGKREQARAKRKVKLAQAESSRTFLSGGA